MGNILSFKCPRNQHRFPLPEFGDTFSIVATRDMLYTHMKADGPQIHKIIDSVALRESIKTRRRKIISRINAFGVMLLLLWMFPFAVRADDFNPSNIISDSDMTDVKTSSVSFVQHFVDSQPGSLSGLITSALGSAGQAVQKRASEIIYEAGSFYRINPRVLLTILQKEQSLVADPTPSEGQLAWATGYGVCDSCSKDDPAIQKYRGFFNQVNWAAKRLRQYFDQPLSFRHQVGQTYSIDGVSVTLQNQATANLYNYTPHINGNKTFWSIWNRWFARLYPDGSLLQVAGQPGVWLIENGKRRPFLTRGALVSRYNPSQIISVTDTDVARYEIGRPIKFPNYSLLQVPSGGVYLLVDSERRAITSKAAFVNLGFNPEEIVRVSWEEIADYPDGPKISLESAYPQGALLQDQTTGGVYYVENGEKHSIMSREILQNRFSHRRIIPALPEELTLYPTSDPVLFKDGTLVTSPGTRSVYVISDGAKRPIGGIEVFERLGYQWKNLVRTSDRALAFHPDGEVIQ